ASAGVDDNVSARSRRVSADLDIAEQHSQLAGGSRRANRDDVIAIRSANDQISALNRGGDHRHLRGVDGLVAVVIGHPPLDGCIAGEHVRGVLADRVIDSVVVEVPFVRDDRIAGNGGGRTREVYRGLTDGSLIRTGVGRRVQIDERYLYGGRAGESGRRI